MHSFLPTRWSVLYATAILVFILAIGEVLYFIYSTQIIGHEATVYGSIAMFLFATPFLGTSIFLFYFIRQHYPSKRINVTKQIFFFICIAIAAVVELLYFFLISKSISSWRDLTREMGQPEFLVKFILVNVLMILQLFNSVRGIRLIMLINRNSKIEFRDVF